MTGDEREAADPAIAQIEKGKYLWEEYKYRHDLIWRLLFRMTVVAVLLALVPVTVDQEGWDEFGFAIKLVPFLALALIGVSWLLLRFEMELFRPIHEAHVQAQNAIVPDRNSGKTPGRDWFEPIVKWYPPVLSVLVIAAAILVLT